VLKWLNLPPDSSINTVVSWLIAGWYVVKCRHTVTAGI